MKQLLTILFICFTSLTNAQVTHYISSSDGNDVNDGLNTTSAWKSLSMINTITPAPGDKVLLKRGDTFYGSITVPTSGSAGSPVTYGAYGTGANPIVTGMQSVTSWTNVGGNVWESTDTVSTLSEVKQVIINGVTVPMGATPNRDTTYPFLPNYYPYQSHTGTGLGATTLTSSSLDGTDWTGADVVVRANHWTLDKESITSSSGTTIGYNGQTAGTDGAGLVDGWGFFIQNDVRTLNQQNEWYYNPSTKKLRIYSTTSPTEVEVTNIDTLFYARIKNYIAVDSIDFIGANTMAVVVSQSNNVTVTACSIRYTGDFGIIGDGPSNYLTVTNCNFSDLGSSGVRNQDGGTNWIIKDNNIIRQGLVSVTKANDYTFGAINIYSPNALIQYNHIDSAAYEGIHFRPAGVQVRNNLVNHYGFLRDDGGGIYSGFPNETKKVIDGNIVLNSIGNGRGVLGGATASNGIYADGLSDSIVITNNIVANIRNAGILMNIDTAMQIHNNTVFNAGGPDWTRGALFVSTTTGSPYAGYVRNNHVTNNIFFQKRPEQYCVFFYESSVADTVQEFGVLDSNFYVKATDTNLVLYKKYNVDYAYLNLPTWQATSGQEAHGMAYADNGNIDTSKIKLVYNATKVDSVVNLGAIYRDVKGVIYNNYITLSPYSGAVLIYDKPSYYGPFTLKCKCSFEQK